MHDATRKAAIADYLSRGWALVPLHGIVDGVCTCRAGAACESTGKHPIARSWRTTPLTRFGEAWEALSQPGCNVGIITGSPSGIWVLDIDPGHDGPAGLAKLVDEHEPLVPTYAVRTGSGGQHLYFAMPAVQEITNARGGLPGGIDVRGTGGLVVAPPSVTNKGSYSVERDVMPEPAPDWLLELIRPPRKSAGAAPTQPGAAADRGFDLTAGGRRGPAYAARAMVALLDELATAPEGLRNATAYRVACRLIELANAQWSGLSLEQAYGSYCDAAERAGANGEAPFPVAEAASVWLSASHRVAGKAAQLPESGWGGEAIPFVTTTAAPSSASSTAETGQDFLPLPASSEPTSNARAGGLVGSGRVLKVTRASEMIMRRTRYVWTGRWPVGVLTFIGGPVSTGKSTVAHDCLAKLTVGTLPGEHLGRPTSVIVAAGEEVWEHTVLPRLVAAGAALERVLRVEVDTIDGPVPISLPTDVAAVTELVRTEGCSAILCDPLMSMLDQRMDSNRYQQVYAALGPVMTMAESTGVALVGITHLNKSRGGDPLTRMMDSRAFTAAPRSVLMTAESPESDGGDARRYLLGQVKHSLGPLAASLEYELSTVIVGADPEDGLPIESSRVAWLGESRTTVAEALAGAEQESGAGQGAARREARTWLTTFLDQRGGRETANACIEAGIRAGHSRRTLQRVAQERTFECDPPGPGSPAYWALAGWGALSLPGSPDS